MQCKASSGESTESQRRLKLFGDLRTHKLYVVVSCKGVIDLVRESVSIDHADEVVRLLLLNGYSLDLGIQGWYRKDFCLLRWMQSLR